MNEDRKNAFVGLAPTMDWMGYLCQATLYGLGEPRLGMAQYSLWRE